VLTAFDTTAGGPATLRYESPPSRGTALIGQALLWALVLLAASRVSVPASLTAFGRRRHVKGPAVIDLDEDHVPLPTESGEVPVLVPLEHTEPPPEIPTEPPRVLQHVPEGAAPPRRGGQQDPRRSWVDDMFAEDDEQETSS
jgi:hypothetical protein